MSTVTQTGAPPRARILLAAVFTALTVALTLVAPHGARAETTPTYAQMMQYVVDETNAVRAEVGLPPLVRNAGLDTVAAAWSLQQWTTGVMSHNPLFSVQIAAGWLRAGENVAKGHTYTQVVPAWKASPTHYANIVNDYNSIGIGYFEQDGRRYWTQLFAKYPMAPVNSAAPTVSGSSAVGSTWTSTTGTWTGTPTPTYKRSWLRCSAPVTTAYSATPSGCTAITGATGTSYVSTSSDIGKYLTVLVTATNSVGTKKAGARTTVATTTATPAAPVNTVAPTVSGSSTVGSTWTSTTGTWSGTPTPTYQRSWLRCSAAVTTAYSAIPTGCTAITGATGSSYVSTSSDVGKYLTVLVTATNSAGTKKAGARTTVATTGSTTPAAPVNTVAPTVSGSSTVGSTWTSTTGTWTGTPAPTYQRSWLRCNQPLTTAYSAIPAGCAQISGATAATYVSTSSDVGKYLTVFVTATNSAGTAKAGARTTVVTG